MYKVERAIIMAAGFGSRMQPITLETPKPLVTVGGVRMIDTVISALRSNGIQEIYVVVGHLKEKFSALEAEYPGLKLIENPYYDTCNNISSLYVAREHLKNVIIMEGDLIIKDPSILRPEFSSSGYNCIWSEGDTNEWFLTVSDGIVRSCSRTGGNHGWQLYGISRWTEQDGQRLRRHLEAEFEGKKHHQLYWDDVALFCYPEEYQLGIMEMQPDAVVEIDSLEELAQYDEQYRRFLEG